MRLAELVISVDEASADAMDQVARAFGYLSGATPDTWMARHAIRQAKADLAQIRRKLREFRQERNGPDSTIPIEHFEVLTTPPRAAH